MRSRREDVRAVIETPLGTLVLRCIIDDLSLPRTADDVSAPTPRAELLSWDLTSVRVELLITHVDPLLPDGMTVERLLGVLWRIRAKDPCDSVRLECRGGLRGQASLASGQALETCMWDADGREVTIGMADGEGFAAMLQSTPSGPRRWRERFDVARPEDVPIAECLSDGLALTLPGLNAGEVGPRAVLNGSCGEVT